MENQTKALQGLVAEGVVEVEEWEETLIRTLKILKTIKRIKTIYNFVNRLSFILY
jgi:hypothetical protein